LRRLFDRWTYNPEVTGLLDYFTLQRLAARSWLRDGEVFAQRVRGNVPNLRRRQHNVPYMLEMLEADFVPYETDPSTLLTNGIELDEWGGPKRYRVYKYHPGDSYLHTLRGDYKWILQRNMIHVAARKRLHQVRGISVFACVLARLEDIKEIDESERVAARVAAAMAA